MGSTRSTCAGETSSRNIERVLAWWIWVPLGVMAGEMIVTNERPWWLAPLCRFPLAAAHRVRSPEKPEDADASDYRAAAGRHVAPWRRLGISTMPDAVVYPVPGTDTFVVQSTGWRRLFLARIDLSQEGEDVVMDAHFLPSPITLLPAALIIVGAVMLHRGVPANLSARSKREWTIHASRGATSSR